MRRFIAAVIASVLLLGACAETSHRVTAAPEVPSQLASDADAFGGRHSHLRPGTRTVRSC